MASEDPNEIEQVLVRRARAKAAHQARMRFIAQAVDPEGQVTVYDLTTQQYRRLWPVDAAEQIDRGLAVLKGQEPSRAPQAPAPDPDQPQATQAPAPPDSTEKIVPVKATRGKHKSAAPPAEAPAPDGAQLQ